MNQSARFFIPLLVLPVALFLSFSLDLAVVLSFCVWWFLKNGSYIPVFLASVTAITAYFIFSQTNISLPFIADLSIDAYLLFVVGIVLYLRSRPDFIARVKLPPTQKLIHFLIGVVSALLIYPLIGTPGLVVGYLVFLFLSKEFKEGRYAFIIALVFLALSPIFLVLGKDPVAETTAAFAYYFILTGVIQEGIKWARSPKVENIENMEFKQINV